MTETKAERTVTCENHGPYTATVITTIYAPSQPPFERKTSCPACEREREERGKRQAVEYKEEQRCIRIEANRMKANIPDRFAGATLESYVTSNEGQRRALSFVKGFAENFATMQEEGSSLTLLGKPGTGKTHLACAVANCVLDTGRTVIYQQVIELVRAIRDTWRRESTESETSVVQRYRHVNLLILDEVGISFGSEAEKTQLFDILDGRYREMRPTLIVSNLSLKGLQECLGERIYDRLMQNGSGCVIFNWESYRSVAPKPRAPAPRPHWETDEEMSDRLGREATERREAERLRKAGVQ
jgi:DNA replication protein DnaC